MLTSLVDQGVLVVVGSDSLGLVPARTYPGCQSSWPNTSGPEVKLCTLPRFEPLSVESFPGSKVDARLKLWIARL